MAEFAAGAAAAAVDLAAQDHAEADSAAKCHHEEVREADAGSEPTLGDDKGVDIVLDHNREAEPLFQEGANRDIAPAEEWREAADAVAAVDGAGHAEAEAEEAAIRADRVGGLQVGNESCQGGDDCLRLGIGAEREGALIDDLGPEVGEGGDDLGLGELGADDEAGLAVEGKQNRAAAAGRDAGLVFVDEVLGDEVGGDAGDCGEGEAGNLGDLGAGDWAAVVDDPQDEGLVDLANGLSVGLTQP
jgi:hypothetical protein